VDFEKQKRTSKPAWMLIGTPGRIIDFYKQHVIDLSSVQVLVLTKRIVCRSGFINDIRYILRRMPAPDKRLNLFSATLSQRVLELAYEYEWSATDTHEPDKMTVERIRQVIYYPSNDEKPRLLVGLIKSSGSTRSMVFVKHAVRLKMWRLLRDNGINAVAISGDAATKRLRMRYFHEARGRTDRHRCGLTRLHIPDVSHVFITIATGPGRLRVSHRHRACR
jgi:ATP-dependent RNA helicase RhlB